MPFSAVDTIIDYLEPVTIENAITAPKKYHADYADVYTTNFPDAAQADLIIIGCGECRGAGAVCSNDGINAVRRHFYQLYNWHKEIVIADIGNLKTGATLQDTYSALQQVLHELSSFKAKVLIIGGSHDIMLAQYHTFASTQKIIEATCIDALMDMQPDSPFVADNFLMRMFTDEPNYLRHYNHIGFQSYFVQPEMLETIDKLRFDCYRSGVVKENMELMEPVIRNADIVGFDIAAIQHSAAPANRITPNGFTGEEACMLMQYAGMSSSAKTIGLYGYNFAQDACEITAKQLSQVIWYLVDGINKGRQEAPLQQRAEFNEFRLMFADFETVFLQSKKTRRWWMQVPGNSFIACSAQDYHTALQNEIPERWLRAAERS